MMHLKIAAPDKVIYNGEISKVTVPTEEGEITVLNNHQPLASVVKAGLIVITPVGEIQNSDEYVVENWTIVMALSKGMLMVDGAHVIVTTSAATTSPSESAEVLQEMQAGLQAELEKIKVEGNQEDLEAAIMNLEKVTADLRLAKFKKVG